VPVIFVRFWRILILFIDTLKRRKYHIYLKSDQWEPSFSKRTDGQTIMAKQIVAFRNWAKKPKNGLLICINVLRSQELITYRLKTKGRLENNEFWRDGEDAVVVVVEFEILCLWTPKMNGENHKHLQSRPPISDKISLTWIRRPSLSNRMLSLRISLSRSLLERYSLSLFWRINWF
jgi:hypothetical protein